jgi:hypothetical protein
LAKSSRDDAIALQQANSQADQAKSMADAFQKERDTIAGSDEQKKLEQNELEIAAQRFQPTERSKTDNFLLASAVGIMGALIGGGARKNSTLVLAGMNGMIDGIKQGDIEKYRQEKDKFNNNLDQLKRTNDALTKAFDRVVKLAATDKEKSYLEAQAMFAQHNAQGLKEIYNKYGAAVGYQALMTQNAQLDKQIQKFRDVEAKAQAQREKFEDQKILKQMEIDARIAAAQDKQEAKKERTTQQQYITQRAVTALRGAASVVESIMRLPEGSNAGILPYLSTKPGMMNYVQNNLGRKITSSESKAVETLYSGVSRYLATIEASGTATGLTVLAGQLDKLKPQPGDTTEDIALKLADIRRISTEAIQGMIDSGLMPDQQSKAAQEQIHRMEKAIPYTTNDVVDAIRGDVESVGELTTKSLPTQSSGGWQVREVPK